MGATEERNKQIVNRFWDALYDHDWDAVAGFFTADANYVDVGLGERGGGAFGGDQVVARLRLGLEPVAGHTHRMGLMVAEGSMVVTEHAEEWAFHTGEVILHPFTSVMEIDGDGRIARWWDYSNLSNLLDNAPAWWLEHIAAGWQETLDSSADPGIETLATRTLHATPAA